MLRGVVHDPTARHYGWSSGPRGIVFPPRLTSPRFARMMLNGGTLDGVRIFKPETVKLMTSVQTPAGMRDKSARLGWDIDSGYEVNREAFSARILWSPPGGRAPACWIDPYSRHFLFFCRTGITQMAKVIRCVVALRKDGDIDGGSGDRF